MKKLVLTQKQMIWTSKRRAEHQFAGWNTQHTGSQLLLASRKFMVLLEALKHYKDWSTSKIIWPEKSNRVWKICFASGFDLVLIRFSPDLLQANEIVITFFQMIGQGFNSSFAERTERKKKLLSLRVYSLIKSPYFNPASRPPPSQWC